MAARTNQLNHYEVRYLDGETTVERTRGNGFGAYCKMMDRIARANGERIVFTVDADAGRFRAGDRQFDLVPVNVL